MDPGYVYLLTDGELFKIGVTRGKIENRIKKLQTGNPYSISLVAYHKSSNPFKIEKMLHARHINKRVNNEWFELSNEDVLSFNSVCEQLENISDALKDNPYFNRRCLITSQ